ncbi:hypothetical protein [Pelagivirga sediminicola]|uniref:hypothetical protein n=1 Tax=Pelagivirga sediminicola TaxID=2170575 RepID=UPI001057059A|nr:hypothetical protein [Pelagivirga sediminicola]
MILDLLDQEDYQDLPTEAGPKWVAIESLARARLYSALERDDTQRTSNSLKLQYMHIVTAAAGELGVRGISIPTGADPSARLDSFMIGVQAAATRVRINSLPEETVFGFRLRNSAKSRLRSLASEIQGTIPELELNERQKIRLQRAIVSFLEELDAPRSRFSIGSGHLVVALTVLNLTVTTTAAGSDALETLRYMQNIWGEEHERSESEKLRIEYNEPAGYLEAPRKQIEGPKKVSTS